MIHSPKFLPHENETASSDNGLRCLLLSIYDMGRQPFGLASTAAWLRASEHRVTSQDLDIDRLDRDAVRAAELIALHLPMHTATRLAANLIPVLKKENPAATLLCFGLYAAMNESFLKSLGVAHVLGGEFEPGLVEIADALHGKKADVTVAPISLERISFKIPDRSGLPSLKHYARLECGTEESRWVGYTEASRGCKHRCKHCPIVPVYDGRFRIVQREIVRADIDQQVEMGATHITFGDPDFFNGIGHAIPILRDLHERHPHVSYDVTIKVEHLLRHRDHLADLKKTGCAFVTSAVESFDDEILAQLEKGHTYEDFKIVLGEFEDHRLNLNPTFIAFSPWISLEGYRRFLSRIAGHDLIERVMPVQLAIRLLIPAGSRLLELEEIRTGVGDFDERALVFPWQHGDPEVDRLQSNLEDAIAEATQSKLTRSEIFERVWASAHEDLGGPSPVISRPPESPLRAPIPYLTEPWYC